MIKHKDLLLRWLNDAYIMEVSNIEILSDHFVEFKEYPEMQGVFREYLEQKRIQVEKVKDSIERLGGKINTGVKTKNEDKIVKNTLYDIATGNFEAANYEALRLAALHTGDQETAEIYQKIIKEERTIIHKIEEVLPLAIQEVLHQLSNED